MSVQNPNVQTPIRVLVVDDHTVVRQGLTFVLQAFADIDPIAEAGNVDAALQACEKLIPDVVLMDLKMAGERDGILAITQIRQRCPTVQILALTSYHEASLVRDAIAAGAVGYLLKDISAEELAQAIRLAHSGTMTLAPEAAQILLQQTPQTVVPTQVELTPRQLEVLQFLAHGVTNQEIALQLQVTLYTARHHVSEILTRLHAANRAEAVAIAVRHGLVKT